MNPAADKDDVLGRAWRLIWIFFVVSFPLAVMTLVFDGRFAFVLVGFAALVAAFGLWTLRCPSCGKLITNRAVRIRGTIVEVPRAFPERTCSKCGRDLRGR